MNSRSKTERIVVVGGGFAGLAAATQLARTHLPVTLLEAAELGTAASTRNQGWLHSGAAYALLDQALAELCYQSFVQTTTFCPECIETDCGSMIFGNAEPDSSPNEWIDAWDKAGIPHAELSIQELNKALPEMDTSRLAWAYRLPDRPFRPAILLKKLAESARSEGVEIRSHVTVSQLRVADHQVQGVEIGQDEFLPARLVISAAGIHCAELCDQLFRNVAGDQPEYELVHLKTHLTATQPALKSDPFFLTGTDSFNHLPHFEGSVFGTDSWQVVADARLDVDPDAASVIEQRVTKLYPHCLEQSVRKKTWAGVTVQAMHAEDVDPASSLRPTVVDHAHPPDRIENILSIFPGRATLWPILAANVEQLVREKLHVSEIETATPPWRFLS